MIPSEEAWKVSEIKAQTPSRERIGWVWQCKAERRAGLKL